MFAPKAGDQRESGWTGARAARAAGVVAVAAMLAPAGVASAAEVSHGTGHIRNTTQTFAVTTLSDSGSGSLRAAIASADAASGAATEISFSVSGTITLASALPAITQRVAIDGTTAPGYISGGAPVVEIDYGDNTGLDFAAGAVGAQLLGVSVVNAGGDGVTLHAASVTLNDDYIGLGTTGTADANRGAGVYAAAGSSSELIGLNASGDSGTVANVISGNRGPGVELFASDMDTVVANRIGTNPAGTAAIPNGGDGVWLTRGSSGNEIGGTEFTDAATGQQNNPTGSKGTVTPVFVIPPLGNLVSGNSHNGVRIDSHSTHNTLNGNFIGTTADGDAALGNGWNGVSIKAANDNSLVGCQFVNNPFVYYNVMSGNRRNGLLVTDANGTKVQGNFFGVGANNTSAVANGLNGIAVNGSSNGTVVGGVIPLGNVTGFNKLNGIDVAGKASHFITFNTFGGLLAFKGAAPNGRDGLLITATGGHIVARTNVFSGNTGNGIEVGGHAHGVTIDPNIVGLTTKGDTVLPNGGDGVLLDDSAHHNTIGGHRLSVIPQNTFSGNDGYGLVITGSAHGNSVFRTVIGTNVGGTLALGNGKGGVLISGHARRNSIGNTGGRPVNIISGNGGPGVWLSDGTSFNRVLDNFIGVGRLHKPVPNSGKPVVNKGHHNKVKGNKS